MTGGRDRFIQQLEAVSGDIDNVPHKEVAALLRRAALRLRNTDSGVLLDPIADDYLTSAAAEMGMTRLDLTRKIINEWLNANTFMPEDLEGLVTEMVDEMGRPDGIA